MSSITLIAFTYRTAPLPILERLALGPDADDDVAAVLCAMRGVEEAVVLSTCNRTEVYLASDVTGSEPWVEVVAMLTGTPLSLATAAVTVAVDDDASLHLFRVTAGLESRIVGERQILGQVRAAVARAIRAGTAGPDLSALFRWAVAGARRAGRLELVSVRSSLARIAMDVAGQRQERSVPVLVVGAGAMAAAVTSELALDHVPYRVCARRTESAARLTCHPEDAIRLEEIGPALRRAELVVCATGARTPIISAAVIADALSESADRHLKVLDLSMPRNVAPDVARLRGVTLYGLDDLVSDRRDPNAEREAATVAAEHDRYRIWLAGRVEAPLIVSLHERIHDACLTEVVRVNGPGPESDSLARSIARKLLHGPTLSIKELRARGDDAGIGVLAAAFGVHPASGTPPPVTSTTSSRPISGRRQEDLVLADARGA